MFLGKVLPNLWQRHLEKPVLLSKFPLRTTDYVPLKHLLRPFQIMQGDVEYLDLFLIKSSDPRWYSSDQKGEFLLQCTVKSPTIVL